MKAAGFQVVDDLGLLNAPERFQGLQFHDDRFVANEIGLVLGFQARALVEDRKFHLRPVGDAAAGHFKGHSFLVHGFKKTAPELPMDFHAGSDDGIGPRISFSTWHDDQAIHRFRRLRR